MQDWTPKDIAGFRKAYKLTRRVLGEFIGVSITSIYQWERGERKPSKTAKILLSRIEQDFKEKGKEGKKHGKRNI